MPTPNIHTSISPSYFSLLVQCLSVDCFVCFVATLLFGSSFPSPSLSIFSTLRMQGHLSLVRYFKQWTPILSLFLILSFPSSLFQRFFSHRRSREHNCLSTPDTKNSQNKQTQGLRKCELGNKQTKTMTKYMRVRGNKRETHN